MRIFDSEPIERWDGKLLCIETNRDLTFRTNETQGFLSAYTFTLLTRGWLQMIYNGRELTLHADDILFYSPGMSVTIVATSPDYQALCLLADQHITIESPTARDLVSIVYTPIVQLHEPKLSLTPDDASLLAAKMREIISYLHSNNIYKTEILRMLYAVFLLDVQNILDRSIIRSRVPLRIEEIFIAFIRLLPQHSAEHHEIDFYASQLNISKVYLSRIVRQVSGRTVMDYINQALLMEASFLLRTSSLSILQIADRLHFADLPSFSRFFSRKKGMSPREYREGE